MTAEQLNPRPGSYLCRALDDGYEITVYPMTLGRARVCYGQQDDVAGFITAYCYDDPGTAVLAGIEWDGKGDPPDGWTRHPDTGRRRNGGDPASETLNWVPVRSTRWEPITTFMARAIGICMDVDEHPASTLRIRREDDADDDRDNCMPVLHCKACRKSWSFVRRHDDMVGVVDLDLTRWELL